jgi:nitrate reductase (cytochrome), electron transfer subunit
MSHKPYASCTQCHVVAVTPMPGGAELALDLRGGENGFVGLEQPTSGPRWTGIAPPQLPHRTWMRENCTSCHGPNGRDAIRSSHPYRQSCTQCHTASEGTAR